MFFSFTYGSTKEIGAGEFECPSCGSIAEYSHRRVTKNRVNIVFFIPFGGVEEVLGEYAHCKSCDSRMDASILLDTITTPDETGVDSSLRNIVTLSEAAAKEIERRMTACAFEPGTYVRLIPAEAGSECNVKFDVPYADDSEWLGRDRGISIVIDRELADLVLGMEIDFDGELLRSRSNQRA